MIEGRHRPDFFFTLQFCTFCLTDCKPYESMTGPMGQRVLSYLLSYLLSRVTSQKPMLFRTLMLTTPLTYRYKWISEGTDL